MHLRATETEDRVLLLQLPFSSSSVLRSFTCEGNKSGCGGKKEGRKEGDRFLRLALPPPDADGGTHRIGRETDSQGHTTHDYAHESVWVVGLVGVDGHNEGQREKVKYKLDEGATDVI